MERKGKPSHDVRSYIKMERKATEKKVECADLLSRLISMDH